MWRLSALDLSSFGCAVVTSTGDKLSYSSVLHTGLYMLHRSSFFLSEFGHRAQIMHVRINLKDHLLLGTTQFRKIGKKL